MPLIRSAIPAAYGRIRGNAVLMASMTEREMGRGTTRYPVFLVPLWDHPRSIPVRCCVMGPVLIWL
jgi:hypothetical protein